MKNKIQTLITSLKTDKKKMAIAITVTVVVVLLLITAIAVPIFIHKNKAKPNERNPIQQETQQNETTTEEPTQKVQETTTEVQIETTEAVETTTKKQENQSQDKNKSENKSKTTTSGKKNTSSKKQSTGKNNNNTNKKNKQQNKNNTEAEPVCISRAEVDEIIEEGYKYAETLGMRKATAKDIEEREKLKLPGETEAPWNYRPASSGNTKEECRKALKFRIDDTKREINNDGQDVTGMPIIIEAEIYGTPTNGFWDFYVKF